MMWRYHFLVEIARSSQNLRRKLIVSSFIFLGLVSCPFSFKIALTLYSTAAYLSRVEVFVFL